MHFIILAALASVAASMPSYIAVPADQIAFVDLRDLRVRRVPRQTLTPPPPPTQLPQAIYSQEYQPIITALPYHPHQHQAISPAARPEPKPDTHGRIQAADSNVIGLNNYNERPPDFGEYVDFGAHTGDQGAFGWYADYPVNNHDSSSSSY